MSSENGQDPRFAGLPVKPPTRIELLEEVVAQARECCSCGRCYLCDAFAALDAHDGVETP